MHDWAVVSVEPIGTHRLVVRFADGVSGEVELRDSFFRGVFAAIRDPAVFTQVHCREGFVAWPGDLDLAPDAMHQEIAQNGRWILQ